MANFLRTACALCVALALCGCGDGKLRPRGQILKGGVPFKVPEGEYVRVVFHPIPEDGGRARNQYVAVYDRTDGTFRVVGADGRGLPPGKYRVAIEHERKKKDLFNGAYDGENSPYVIEVNGSSGNIVIDLNKRG
jgi:hypothetical protein